MDVRIYQGEELIVTAVDAAGNEKTIRLSWKSIMMDGVTMVDGLTEKEVAVFCDKRKIMAIKMVRERTGYGLKEAKDLVDAWATKNKCCVGWPYCVHNNDGLDISKVKISLVGTLAMGWHYPVKITEAQARQVMKNRGYNPDGHGFWSFTPLEDHTTWMSNRFANKG